MWLLPLYRAPSLGFKHIITRTYEYFFSEKVSKYHDLPSKMPHLFNIQYITKRDTSLKNWEKVSQKCHKSITLASKWAYLMHKPLHHPYQHRTMGCRWTCGGHWGTVAWSTDEQATGNHCPRYGHIVPKVWNVFGQHHFPIKVCIQWGPTDIANRHEQAAANTPQQWSKAGGESENRDTSS